MGRQNKEVGPRKPEDSYGKEIGATIKNSCACIYVRKSRKPLAKLLISQVVPIEENKQFIMAIAHRYFIYLKEGQAMELNLSRCLDVNLNNGIANIIDKRDGQVIAMLKYNTHMPAMETMAFINAVMQDYEKYMRLMAKRFNG